MTESIFKLLLVEDNAEDIATCRSSIKVYQRKYPERLIELVESTNVEDAFVQIDSTFDGAIIDLRLDDEGGEGYKVIEKIHQNYRIPIIILTGSPSNLDETIDYVLGTHIKGEAEYETLFNDFFQVYNTGLTKILGGRGAIENALSSIFWKNLLPQLDTWRTYANSKSTEKALLRYAIHNLMELLDEENSPFFPEEMYICPPISIMYKTGSIVTKDGVFFVILSPACDLVIHKGNLKTDSILVCNIEGIETVREKNKGERERCVKNSFSNYYHYLPPMLISHPSFTGGLINFRKAQWHNTGSFEENFGKPVLQISSPFVKDIVSRFSSYYARQGQPDFDTNLLLQVFSQS